MQAIQTGSSSDISEIQNRCLTSSVEFLKKSQHYPSIKQSRNNEGFLTLVGNVISAVSILAGIKSPIDDLNKADIVDMLFSSFSDFSIEDIYFAFKNERYGAYNDKTKHFDLMNADYISEILKKYRVWKRIKKVEHNISSNSVALLPEMSDVQKKKIHYDSLCATYERIKNDGYDEMAWLVFPYIKNKITLTIEEKKAIYKQEEVKYLNALKQSDKKSDRYEFKTFPKHEQTGRYNSAVQTQCQIRMVIEFVKPHLATLETFLKAIGYEE